MGLAKTILIIAGVAAGGIAVAHVAKAALNPGGQKTTDPGAQPYTATTSTSSATSSTSSSSATITKSQRLQELQASLAKYQGLVLDAQNAIATARAAAPTICSGLYFAQLFGVEAPCEAYARGDADNAGKAQNNGSWPQVKPKADINRTKIQTAQANLKSYQANVASIQNQVDQLNAQGVY